MPEQMTCPYCGSQCCEDYAHYQTQQNGSRLLCQCMNCQQIFSETKGTFLEGLRKPISFIANVLKTRVEGMGFNATCRAFEISKNSLLLWERRLAGMKKALLLYALMHTFLTQIIEARLWPFSRPETSPSVRADSGAGVGRQGPMSWRQRGAGGIV
jgi:hypothetical protein